MDIKIRKEFSSRSAVGKSRNVIFCASLHTVFATSQSHFALFVEETKKNLLRDFF